MIYYIAREKITFIHVFSNMRNYAVHFLCNNSFYLEKSHTILFKDSADAIIHKKKPGKRWRRIKHGRSKFL